MPLWRTDPVLLALYAALTLGPELRRWRRLGRRPRLWWRDDDARAPTPELERLLTCAGERPLALAVIPDGRLGALATRLSTAQFVAVGQHGADHVNRSPPGTAASEYPPGVARSQMAEMIEGGRDAMRRAGLRPAFFAPPWNTVQTELPGVLKRAGYALISAGQAAGIEGLASLPADVDVLRWKRGPRFKGGRAVFRQVRRALERRRTAQEFDLPVGLLTHHLDHDEATWRFLKSALPWLELRFDWAAVG